ncbi:hypothetical protein PT273_09045 [Orbaceae bacterium ESL0727]|nr:hypothetical protein [Orbaceae bacterium ESL0727]MDF7667985.1 hypothetical protein [Orbaceae bacterium ESL0727]
MTRQANTGKEAIELPAINEQGITDVMNTMTTIQSEYSDDRDLANQLLGQAQMARSIAKFADVVSLTKLSHVKESKLYKALAGKTFIRHDGTECRLVGTWEEYCKLLGSSKSSVDEDLINLKNFGEQALEEMSRIGIGYRELRQYRKLPEDQKTALIEVAKAGDKEALVELAEEFIAKSTKEKEELEKENKELKADYDALSKHSSDIAKEKSELNLKLNKYVLKAIPLDERLDPFKKQIAETQSRIDELLEKQRQYVAMMDTLQKETMANDPNYDPEQPYELPPSLLVTIITLHESLKLTVSQSKNTYQSLWMNFSDEIDPNA